MAWKVPWRKSLIPQTESRMALLNTVRSSACPTRSLRRLPMLSLTMALFSPAMPPTTPLGPHPLFCSLWSSPVSSVLFLKHAWHSSASGPLHWPLLLHECSSLTIHMAHILISCNCFSKCLFLISHSQTALHKSSQPHFATPSPLSPFIFSTFCSRFAILFPSASFFLEPTPLPGHFALPPTRS